MPTDHIRIQPVTISRLHPSEWSLLYLSGFFFCSSSFDFWLLCTVYMYVNKTPVLNTCILTGTCVYAWLSVMEWSLLYQALLVISLLPNHELFIYLFLYCSSDDYMYCIIFLCNSRYNLRKINGYLKLIAAWNLNFLQLRSCDWTIANSSPCYKLSHFGNGRYLICSG